MPYRFSSIEQAQRINERVATVAQNLSNAFAWRGSSEGFDYWALVRRRLDQVVRDAEIYIYEEKFRPNSVSAERATYAKWAGRRAVELRGGAGRI